MAFTDKHYLPRYIRLDPGLKEGDIIEIATPYGRKVEGVLKLMEGQHPQTMGIAACSGHRAKGQPIVRGKGTLFDILDSTES